MTSSKIKQKGNRWWRHVDMGDLGNAQERLIADPPSTNHVVVLEGYIISGFLNNGAAPTGLTASGTSGAPDYPQSPQPSAGQSTTIVIVSQSIGTTTGGSLMVSATGFEFGLVRNVQLRFRQVLGNDWTALSCLAWGRFESSGYRTPSTTILTARNIVSD